MESGYFRAAWGDIKNSPGWFGKLCLLALLNFIPIFGSAVSFGYFYGWARDAAWGVHEPLPRRIFGNEDGKLYVRGFSIWLLSFVLGLIGAVVSGFAFGLIGGFSAAAANEASALGSFIGFAIDVVCAVLVAFFTFVGSMRIAVYGRLSAGFQFGKVWKMIRRDTGGLVRIFLMQLVVALVVVAVLGIIVLSLLFAFIGGGFGVISDVVAAVSVGREPSEATLLALGSMILGFIALLIPVGYLWSVADLFIELLAARALGYWLRSFEVEKWGGQNDPLPFEASGAAVPATGEAPARPADAPADGEKRGE